MEIKYNRGSEWIKCDLHLHTPETKLNKQGFKLPNDEDSWGKYCQIIEESDVQIFGITDYFSIENYFKFLEKFNDKYPNSSKVFFPNIEFRLDVSVNKTGEEVNIHVIFSNENEVTKEKLMDFLSKLETNITRNGSPLTCEKLSGSEDFKRAAVKYSDLRPTLKKVFGNNEDYIILAASNNQGLRADTKSPRKLNITDEIDKICDAFFGGEQNVDYYLDPDRYEQQGTGKKEIAKKCPVFSGCDAHSFDELENKLGKIYEKKDDAGNICDSSQSTWVKIEPTFEGIKYLTYEPEDRVFIGEIPEVEIRVNTNKTRYIHKLTIDQEDDYNESKGIWFKNQEAYLSKELTAIIGNKGKGKSAITDIIGLLGNSHNERYFSFLDVNRKKFRKDNLASNFKATLEWESKTPITKNLSENTDKTLEEKVKYLPQSYFEDLCNEIDNNENFEREINQVVFKHLDETDRLGKNTFNEFIQEKKRSSELEINTLQEKLSESNEQIEDLLMKDTEDYKKGIESKISGLEEDLKSHLENKPIDPFPDSEKNDESKSDESSENYKKLKEAEKALNELLETNESYLDKLESVNGELVALNQIHYRFESERDRIKLFREYEESELSKFGIQIDAVYPEPKINFVPINKQIGNKEKEKLRLQLNLGKLPYIESEHQPLIEKQEDLLANKISRQRKLYDEISKSLDATQKAKEKYNSQLQKWEKDKKEIEGDSESPRAGSLNYFKEELKYIENILPVEIKTQKANRRTISEKIYDEKKKVLDIYAHLKSNIDTELSNNSQSIEEYKITIDASLQIKDLNPNFLEFIDKSRIGQFQGNETAEKKVKELIEVTDVNNKESFFSLLDALTEGLEYENEDKRNPFKQIKATKKLKNLFDYVFGLDYLNEVYELKFADKNIEQLSPGERGAALIVFYLLLDKDDKPLIIDQPEDNLDNQSVFEILVPFIKKAKKKRQLIIVTHNPNLAVVADAEQIIHVDIDKENNYKFSFNSGGIERPSINKGIVTILEGTMPAFAKRKLKYLDRSNAYQ
jgi:ABC-type lipoprotein export system ATPase subunit